MCIGEAFALCIFLLLNTLSALVVVVICSSSCCSKPIFSTVKQWNNVNNCEIMKAKALSSFDVPKKAQKKGPYEYSSKTIQLIKSGFRRFHQFYILRKNVVGTFFDMLSFGLQIIFSLCFNYFFNRKLLTLFIFNSVFWVLLKYLGWRLIWDESAGVGCL